MEIRSAQVTDLAQIEKIYNEGLTLDLSGKGANTPVKLWQIINRVFASLIPLAIPSDLLYVLESENEIKGFIQGEIIYGNSIKGVQAVGIARILNLALVKQLPPGTGGMLIDHLCNESLQKGISRVYVRVPEKHPVIESFKAQGFLHYASEEVLYIDDIKRTERRVKKRQEGVEGLRKASQKDLFGLFNLYLASTPKKVSAKESPDFAHWIALYGSEWLNRFSQRSHHNLVVERTEIIGWLGITFAHPGEPHTLSIMARPNAKPKGALQGALLREGVASLRDSQGAAWCNVRNYDISTTRVLQMNGFETLTGQELMVRESKLSVLEKSDVRMKNLKMVFN